jgi:ABC-type lipoprotein release transport system permease subunit
VQKSFLVRAIGPVAFGTAGGVLAALPLTRFVRSLLFGVTPTDPSTYVMVAALISALALVAAWLPARRASRVEPSRVLSDA